MNTCTRMDMITHTHVHSAARECANTGGAEHPRMRGAACINRGTRLCYLSLGYSHTFVPTHTSTHTQTNTFPPRASLVLLSHLVIHLSHFPFPSASDTLHSNAHTCTYHPLSQCSPLPGSLQYELAEMYSCCQGLCARNKTQRQPNVIISG